MNQDSLSYVGGLHFDSRLKRVVAVGIAAGAAAGATAPALRRDEDDGIAGAIPIVCQGVKAVVTSAARFDAVTGGANLYVETFEQSGGYETRIHPTFLEQQAP